MQTNNEYLDEWPVRPYSKRELAMAYAPDISPSSALNRLAGWVRHHRKLSHELDETGYQNRQRIFTSLQVELIFRYLPSLNEDLPRSLSRAYIGIASCVYRRWPTRISAWPYAGVGVRRCRCTCGACDLCE